MTDLHTQQPGDHSEGSLHSKPPQSEGAAQSAFGDTPEIDALHSANNFVVRSKQIMRELCLQAAHFLDRAALVATYSTLFRESEAWSLNFSRSAISAEALATRLVWQAGWSQGLRRDLDGEGDPASIGRRMANEWRARRESVPKETALDAATNARILPFFLVPDFDALSSAMGAAESALLMQYYGPSSPHRAILRVPESVLANSPQDALRVAEIITRLSGLQGSLAKTLKDGRGTFPLVLPPLTIEVVGGALFAYATQENYRVPYGILPISQQYLESQQQRIEKGELKGYTLELSARVYAPFLLWAFGAGRQDMGPIPDIEILYSVPLPSGAEYTFVLKEARSYSQRAPNDESKWTKEDWFIVNVMGEYFRSTSHRKAWDIFDKIRVEDFPEHMQGVARDPLSISSYKEYQEFCVAWRQSLYKELSSMEGGPRETYRRVPWLEPRFSDPQLFGQTLRERLSLLPEQQSFFPPNYLRLNDKERAAFLHSFEGKLFQLCCSERQRVAREASDGSHAARIAAGYEGPEEGFPLPLDYMIMDLIVDERRYQEYRAERARKQKVQPSEVRVPLLLGRSYWHPEWFLDCAGVAAQLKSDPPKRELKITLRDPLLNPELVSFPASKILEVGDYLQRINIERLSKAIHALSVSEDSATGAGPRQHHLKALHASEAVLLERVRAAEGEFEEARRERSAMMAAADATLKTAGPSSEYRARVYAFRKPFDDAVQQRLLALRGARSEILEFYDEEWPGGVTRYAIKLESIVDRQVATYIFSIGADGKPVFAPEHVGFKRTHSESLQGKNMYAGGEISFSTHDVSFRSLEAWIKFDQQLSTLRTPLPLTLAALTDGSGHYEPLPATLQYANNIICPRFAALGIETAHVKHRDGLAPFVRMRGLTYDFGRTAQDGRGPSAQ